VHVTFGLCLDLTSEPFDSHPYLNPSKPNEKDGWHAWLRDLSGS